MFHPGDVIDGRYDVLGPLGHGGMGHVFRAHDRRLERTVALKVLRPHLTELDADRFRREIRALARLNHPAVVSIYDLGQGEHVYFAMELVDGGAFTDLGPLAEDPEPFAALLDGAAEVADALAYVHRLGMVHRDLTPRNILLTESGRPKLMDFGLVQLTETSRQLTRTGSTLGTPQYMAPEQATGDATGAATDLYAFGAVLYRAATGVAPFDAENDQAIMYQHVYHEPTAAVDVHPAIPPALSELLARLLAKQPAGRPDSAATVADALRAIRADGIARTTHRPHAGSGHRSTYPTAIADAAALRPRWQVRLEEGPQWPAGMAAADGFLLVGQRADALAVLRPADGAVHARFELEDEVSAPPLVAGGHLWLAARDGSLQARTWPAGERAWLAADVDAVGLTATGADVLVARRDGRLERWGAGPREVRWSADLGAPAATAATLHGHLALVVADDGWLHALDARDGAARFRVDVGAMAAPPVSAGAVVLLATRSGEIHAFDPEAHVVRWSYDVEGETWAPPAVAERLVFVGSWGPRLHALHVRSGDDAWSVPLAHPVTAAPVVAGGVVYVANEGGELLAFDARTGAERARHRVASGAVQASPLPLGDALFVAALDGTVTCLR
ncbi:MAG: PQQ-binding-like beta-propeller repeat protein [Trueperaceae bacterium]